MFRRIVKFNIINTIMENITIIDLFMIIGQNVENEVSNLGLEGVFLQY